MPSLIGWGVGGAGWRGAVVTADAATLMLRSRINPLWLWGAGGVLGGLGLV